MREKRNWLARKKMELTLSRVIEFYHSALELEGKSINTIEWYQQKLEAFLSFLQLSSQQILVRDLSLYDGRAFIRSLMERDTLFDNHPWREEVQRRLSPHTIHGYVRTLRAFASWLEEEGYTDENIFKRLKLPKLPETLIQPLTEDEIKRILFAIPRDTTMGVRNYAIVLLFLDTGIRISELANLKLDDIEFGEGHFKVFGKGARERIVPMGITAQRAVIRYMERSRPEPVNPSENRLFLTDSGDPMSKNSTGKVIQRLARRAEVHRLHPHLFRHTFAVRYLKNGGDVFSLQKILGHKSLDVTRRYVQLAGTDLKEKHRLFSPVDNLGLAGRRRGRPRQQR